MNLQHERIAALCAQLKLDCVATDWAPLAQRTAAADSSMADFLEQLLQAELGAREERKRQVLTKLAALPGVKAACSERTSMRREAAPHQIWPVQQQQRKVGSSMS
ncbi:ATP-binding protein [Caballeronia sp. EK]|uniref:ATP-binding protein n=1 Tax=Caballeronia sp. EK TaxID=2767469 RepID=UPI001CA39E2C|nr:ATP-binding protein [Caballeronia sp. EK]